jgi:hypothetical protein
VLAKNGVESEIVYPACCGMPQLEQGDLARVADSARRISAVLVPWIDEGYDVVALVPSCALMLKFEWPLILPKDAAVKQLSEATFDVTEYIVDIAKHEGLAPGLQPLDGGVALHIACHARAQNMGQKATEMMRLIPAADVAVIERCSGHGGSWGIMKETLRPPSRSAGRWRGRPMTAARPTWHRNARWPGCTSSRAWSGWTKASSRPEPRSIRSNFSRALTVCSRLVRTVEHSMAMKREITREDLMTPAEYAKVRAARRQAVVARKQNRRLEVGPVATFHFEDYDSMWLQVQEMLYIEKGGEAQIAGELSAYNPLIPNIRSWSPRSSSKSTIQPGARRLLSASVVSRIRPSFAWARGRSRACRRPTSTARAPTARLPPCNSSTSRSRRLRYRSSAPRAQVIVGFAPSLWPYGRHAGIGACRAR